MTDVDSKLNAYVTRKRVPLLPGRGLGTVSFGQRRVWFLEQLNGGSPEFNVVFGWRLSGGLDVAALRGAVEAVVERHEVLRTCLREVDGDVVGVLGSVEGAVSWGEVGDFWGRGEEAVSEAVSAEAVLPFDLSCGPLIRVRVLRTGECEWVVLFVVHHVVFDGWSAGVFAAELSEFYEAAVSGRPAELSVLPVQYGDYAVWQQEVMSGERFVESVEYWRHRLAGLSSLELPSDFPRSGPRSWVGGSVRFRVPAATVGRLREIAVEERSTLFMAVLAGFDVLMSRWAGTEDVAVGTPVAGRGAVELESLVGLFFNAVVMRAEVPRSAAFRDVLRNVREVALGAFGHQDVPFERLVEELRPVRELGQTPLFQVWFEMDNTPDSNFALPGVSVVDLEVPSEVSKFDVSVSLVGRDGGLDGGLVFRRDLFTDETGRRLASAFVAILEQIAEDPDIAIADLALMSEDERERILVQYNATTTSGSVDELGGCVPDLISGRSRECPDAVAVVGPDGRAFNFAELESRANQVAQFLRASGVGSETVVGVCLDRGFDLVATLLGVLRSGAAYVPLEPGFPAERCEYVLGDAGAEVVLTQENLTGMFGWFAGQVVAVDVSDGPIARSSTNDPGVLIDPGSLAYIIYTSGSTGRPKGVMVEHGSLANFVRWCVKGYAFRAEGGAPLFSSLAFDAVVPNLYTPLVLGQPVHVFEQDLDLSALGEQLVERGPFSFIKLTPSHLELLWRQLGARQIADLAGVLVVGAEAFPASALQFWPFDQTDTVLLNEYGPTEATVANSVYHVNGPVVTHTVPIGSPIPNTTMYVLDEAMRPVPVGVVGEVFIGGACVARGYCDRPSLTARSFVPDPFSPVPGTRLYRTGDRGRMLAEGAVEFLGRADDQIKIHGYRIEPGEIAAAIMRHPAVSAAHVTPHYDGDAATGLIAYLVPVDPNVGLDVEEISEHLRAVLPSYMRPQQMVVLPELPLTPHGKIDRAALPAPEAASAVDYEAPATELECALAEIWQDVLGIGKIGVHDNFFALGGHSLLAVQLLSRIRKATPFAPSLTDLFENPTINQLSHQVGLARSVYSPLLPGRGLGTVSFGQRRVWFLEQLNGGSPEFNVVFGWRLSGGLDVAALRGAVEAVVERHEVLRTCLREVDGDVVGVLGSVEGAVSWGEVGDFWGRGEEAVSEAVSAEAVLPFDLSCGPLIRVRVLRTGECEWVVLFVVHHVVFDGWSAGVFAAELSEFYEAAVSGRPAELSVLPVQYGDYAVWQQEVMSGERFVESVEYWRHRLAGLSSLELPSDFPRSGPRSWVGGSVRFRVPAATVGRLREIAVEERSTLFMAVLAGFDVLMSRWAGTEDVAVGTPVAGRGAVELESLVGLFFNAVVMRAEVPRSAAFRDVLRNVREVALGAFGHQDVPFERLVEELRPVRELGQTPLFQVWFEMDNTPDSNFALPGVSVVDLEVPSEVSKFDVSVSLVGRDGGLDGGLVFRRDLFTDETGRRLASAFVAILEQIAEDPDIAIADLALMSEDERERILVQYNATTTSGSVDELGGCVPDLISGRSRECPDAVAVVGPDGRAFNFAELESRANQVAQFLRASGVGSETVVGVCLDRGFDLVATLLGVLRSGAAYVPLEPGFPAERCEYVLGDAGAEVVLTQENLTGMFGWFAGQVVAVDVSDGPIARSSTNDPGVLIDPGSLAYIIYTSGSTGRPKGVMVEHGSLANFVRWCVKGYAFRAEGGAPLFSSLAFDAVVPNLYTPLVLGQPVHVFEQDLDLSALGEQLVERGPFSFIKLTPSHLELLWRQLGARQIADLAGVLVVGAEAFPASALQFWPFDQTDTVLLNEYGPTEATVANSVYHVNGPVVTHTVPIGSPIPNTTMYVLDEAMRPVPVGVVGEVFIGGACVARGYCDRPSLTARSFVPDPFSPVPGTRLYRTGDRGRMLAEGAVEFLGRADDQIKIHGYRIEPGEIAAAIMRHPAVSAAHVTPHYDGDAATGLIAYLVPVDPNVGLDVEEISEHLRAVLPSYMRPQQMVVLPELPLTPHGKIDRAALPAPEAASAVDYEAPATELECALAEIWQDVLGIGKIGVHDNFFALGGHSLLAVQLLSRIRKATPFAPSLTDLFENPTINQLTKDARATPGATLVTLRKPEPGGRILFCVHPSGGSVHWYRHLAVALNSPDGLLAFQARGVDGQADPHTTVEEMASAYVAELRQAQPCGPYYLLGWSLSGPIVLEMTDQLERQGEQVQLLLLEPSLPDASTVESLRQCIADHRRAVQLVDELAARRTAGKPTQDVLDQISSLVAASDVIDESVAALPDSLPVMAASLLYEAFCASRVPQIAGEVTVLVTSECLAADSDHPSKAAITSFSTYEQTLYTMIPRLRVERIEGDHYTMLDAEHAPSIIAEFRRLAAEEDAL
ncbi:amino acid adenylation domain-containing protein [Streptomyces sp. NPDC087511]|uniref:amino acid adenylation domain-containing protein n=1 Tax=Streptomyces sp. NPDC087511 TaxID=3365792 RepID=UPI00380837EB